MDVKVDIPPHAAKFKDSLSIVLLSDGLQPVGGSSFPILPCKAPAD